jgi:mono/diheme cytochrome c family protein
MKKLIFSLLAFGLVSGLLTACDPSKPNIELIQDQMEQESVKAQEYDDFFADHAGGARVPPEHTKPIGFKHYAYAKDAEGAARNPNPLAGNVSSDVLLTGQKFYETHCMVCHGMDLKAQSDLALSGKYPLKIPALDSDKIKGWSDGQIYHVITVGQGVMGPYASHIPQSARWQVVNYIRYLQKK